MSKLFILLIVPFLFACCITKKEVENNYFVYADGEWIQVDENPMADDEVKNDEDKIVPDGMCQPFCRLLLNNFSLPVFRI